MAGYLLLDDKTMREGSKTMVGIKKLVLENTNGEIEYNIIIAAINVLIGNRGDL